MRPSARRPAAAGPKKTRAAPQLSEDEKAFVRSLVIYEDADILALNKPPGLSSQGGRGQVHTLDELLFAFAKPSGVKPRLVHRLDRDTSGVILTARSQPAAAFLGKALMRRRFRKTYLAIVTPCAPAPPAGLIEAPLRRDESGREAFMRVCDPGHPDAEAALTRYRTLAEGPASALVEASPQTGRMHQIRVHLASIGRPIAGDARYGGALTLAGEPVPRLMLHAFALEFPHPGGELLRITAAPPADFVAIAREAGLDLPQTEAFSETPRHRIRPA
jgi:tRNA pseudouridine32 synthase/23S rRNA pseudouridine746 synthase